MSVDRWMDGWRAVDLIDEHVGLPALLFLVYLLGCVPTISDLFFLYTYFTSLDFFSAYSLLLLPIPSYAWSWLVGRYVGERKDNGDGCFANSLTPRSRSFPSR